VKFLLFNCRNVHQLTGYLNVRRLQY